MILGTLTTGAASVDTIRLNYLPQYIYYVAATQLTSIRVSVAGEAVILDLATGGLNVISGMRRYGAVANSYLIPLADGFIPNKVVEITTVNSAAQTPIIYGASLRKGQVYMTNLQTTVLAASGQLFEDFSHLGVVSMGATDALTVGYVDGHIQEYNSVELLGYYTLFSNEVDSYCIDNFDGAIDYVKLIPAADRVVVISKWLMK